MLQEHDGSSCDARLVTAEAMERFTRLKQKLWDLERVHGASYFTPRPDKGRVGLFNQGATCYLNSLLQTLYMLPDMRATVLCEHSSSTIAQELKVYE
jgi:uncharacterized UBP type Zn finger protein